MKESMYVADREHKESLARMEHKFFIEKVCIQELRKMSLSVWRNSKRETQRARSKHLKTDKELEQSLVCPLPSRSV